VVGVEVVAVKGGLEVRHYFPASTLVI
jgi:hypothetical protein